MIDERWAKMRASIGVPDYDILDPAPDEWYKNVLEFRIEVHYDGMTYWSVQYVDREILPLGQIDIYAFVLNEMIKMIDERLDEHDKEKR